MRSEHRQELKLRRRNLALTVAYDDTNYNGFQWQSPPRVAVQTRLNFFEAIFVVIICVTVGGLNYAF